MSVDNTEYEEQLDAARDFDRDAEIERLQAALHKIHSLRYTASTLGDARRIAKIALGLKTTPEIKEGEIRR